MSKIIPTDWNTVLLDSIAKRGSGHTPNKKKKEFWGGEIKWVSLKDSNKLDKLFINETESQITQEGIKNSSAVLHPAGTVILSRDAGVGKSAILKQDMAVSQHFMTWTCGEKLNNYFLYHWLQRQKREFERIAVGSTIKTIGLPYFKKLKITIPEKVEQDRIIQVLKNWDKAIEALAQKIEIKKNIKKGLMQQLLTGKKRLPGFNADWSLVKIGEFLEEVINKTTINNEFPVLTSSRRGLFLQSEYFDKQVASKDDIGYKILKNGEFTYRAMTDDGKFAFNRLDKLDTGIISPAYAVFKPKYINSNYLLFVLNTRKFGYEALKYAQGGTRQSLKFKSLSEVEIRIPNIEEQTAIAQILTTADDEIIALEKKKQKLEDQKKHLLNNLITGQIRTPENLTMPEQC